MHRGCFVWTPTPTLFGSEDAKPGSCACVRVRALLGRVGRAGLLGEFWCASPFLWPVCCPALLSPLRAGVPLCVSFFLPSFVSLFFSAFFRAAAVIGVLRLRALGACRLGAVPRVFFGPHCPPALTALFFFAPPLSSASFCFLLRVSCTLALCGFLPSPPLCFVFYLCGVFFSFPPASASLVCRWSFSALVLLFCFSSFFFFALRLFLFRLGVCFVGRSVARLSLCS